MSDQLTDAPMATAPSPSRERSRRRSRRTDWRLGGRTVRRWNMTVVAVALVSLGVGIVAGALVSRIAQPWAGPASAVILWVAMAVPVVFAFARSRPVGLLRFRAVDVLYAVVLGLGLRVLQGVLAGDQVGFPSLATLDGVVPPAWLLTDAVPTALVAPLLEELFFRAVLLVAIYQLLRRAAGGVAAGCAAVLLSTGGFVLLHAIGGAVSVSDAVTLGAVGATCALLVLLTGRIWGAVLTHVVYNASYLVLALVGTALS